ncbi:phosphate ABC transporter substrate-binding protein PstS [Amnibacterium sp.]|uniref:phosphate ABC transporter substrate-binding protein PstS n=1 Tax=Amnibacterium sp. TaxID=1872496 RepID=UPI003F7C4ACF
MRAGLAIGTAITAIIALSSCASNEAGGSGSGSSSSASTATLSGQLNGQGSSAQGNAQTQWIKDFQTANSGVTINYNPVGSGAGRTAFEQGGAQYAGSDTYLSSAEVGGTFALCNGKGIDLPDYISPIALAFNVKGVSSLNLDATTLAKIFSGKITTWNDPAIKALNSGANLPATKIDPVHRSDKSGTTHNFTDYLNKTAPSVWTNKGDDTFPYKTGEGAQGTSGVVAAIKGGNGTIGYIDNSQVGSLTVAKVKVGSTFVAPSADGAAKAAEAGTVESGRDASDFAIDVNRTTTDPTQWPITLISNLIVCKQYKDPSVGKLVGAYATYVTSTEGQAAGAKVAGSAPMSAALIAKVQAVAKAIK